MEIESESESNNEELDIEVLTLNTDKKLVLSRQAQSLASSIYSRRSKTAVLNQSLDPNNTSQKYPLSLKTKQFGNFQHFLTKNKHRSSRIEVITAVRQLAQSKDYVLSGRVCDKLQRSKMILRVISKQSDGLVIIEDETGKEKMIVRSGTVWVGLIALMEVTWVDNSYKLDTIFDLGTKMDNTRSVPKQPTTAYRILFVKGAFMNNQSKDNTGLKVLINELKILKDKEKTKVNCIIIMGPLLNCKNKALNNFLQLTYEEQAIQLIKLIKDQVSKINDQMQIVLMPSTDDLNSYYPIPQPKFSFSTYQKNMYFTSNPGFIHLEGARERIKIDMINMDINNYIDQNRTGKPMIEPLQENLQTYFKQPFYLTNTNDQPFDQTNLPALYNSGEFGDIVVTSSRKSPPFAREVKGKVFVNIGSLGIDQQNLAQKHFMTLVSIYDGSGPIGPRTRVETLSM